MLSTQARVFKRSVTLSSVAPAAERRPAQLVTHGNVTWVHADEAMAAPTVTFPLPESIEGDLFLIVEEGDNQPLPIDKATILLPSFAMRLFRRPDLPLRLIYGKDHVPAPRYDLQLLAPQLMGRLAEEVAPGPEQRFGESASASARRDGAAGGVLVGAGAGRARAAGADRSVDAQRSGVAALLPDPDTSVLHHERQLARVAWSIGATVSDDNRKSLRPARVADAGASRRQSVHAPAGSVHDDSSTPLSEARMVAPLACAARNRSNNRTSAGCSIRQRSDDVRADHRYCCVPACSARCQPGTETLVVIGTDVERARRRQRGHRRLADTHGMVARFERGGDGRASESAATTGTPIASRECAFRINRDLAASSDASPRPLVSRWRHSPGGAAPSAVISAVPRPIDRGIPAAFGEDLRHIDALRGAQDLAGHFAAKDKRGRAERCAPGCFLRSQNCQRPIDASVSG